MKKIEHSIHKHTGKGFSLIELMAALIMGIVIVGMLIVYYTQEKKHQVIMEGRSEAMQSAEAVLRVASKELRAIPGNTAEFQNIEIFKIWKIYYNSSGNDTFCYFSDVYPASTFGNNSLDTAYETFGLVYNSSDKNVYNVRYQGGAYVYNVLITGVEDFNIIPYNDTGGVVTDTSEQGDIAYVDLEVVTYNERGAMGEADTITFSRRITVRSRL
ncbi:MAG: hypothetical protein APR63_09020 [Desulfuromonas sp. SDB]|nr:MAG: hypothetical protein APR63_09020 [Desulfuromonas sp. SDB]